MGSIGQGYFSLLRWRSDSTRDEGRNVAVLVVEPDAAEAALRAAPVSTVSSRLREQGVLDAILLRMRERLDADPSIALKLLEEWHSSLERSLYLTEPQPVAVTDFPSVLDALYRAFVSPRHAGGRVITKGVVLDRAVDALRARGYRVARGAEVGAFIFDAILQRRGEKIAIEALSFATTRKDWTPILHDAGHFLFALHTVKESGLAVIQPPPKEADRSTIKQFERVTGWFDAEEVPTRSPDELATQQSELPI